MVDMLLTALSGAFVTGTVAGVLITDGRVRLERARFERRQAILSLMVSRRLATMFPPEER
jgi:hypothetical protein